MGSECKCELCETCESDIHGIKNVGDSWDDVKDACKSYTCMRKEESDGNCNCVIEETVTPCPEKPVTQKGFYIEETYEQGKCCPIYSAPMACKACDTKQMEKSCPEVEKVTCGKCARAQVKNLVAGEECCCPCEYECVDCPCDPPKNPNCK